MPDLDFLTQLMPPIEAAVAAYGMSVFTRAEDAAADETVRLGQRLLQRITGRFGRGGAAGAEAGSEAGGVAKSEVESSVRLLAEAEPDEAADATAALRLQLRKLLKADPQLRDELVALFPAQSSNTASGTRSVVVGGDASGIVSTGDGAVNIQRN